MQANAQEAAVVPKGFKPCYHPRFKEYGKSQPLRALCFSRSRYQLNQLSLRYGRPSYALSGATASPNINAACRHAYSSCSNTAKAGRSSAKVSGELAGHVVPSGAEVSGVGRAVTTVPGLSRAGVAWARTAWPWCRSSGADAEARCVEGSAAAMPRWWGPFLHGSVADIEGVKNVDDSERRGVEDVGGAAYVNDADGAAGVRDVGRDAG